VSSNIELSDSVHWSMSSFPVNPELVLWSLISGILSTFGNSSIFIKLGQSHSPQPLALAAIHNMEEVIK